MCTIKRKFNIIYYSKLNALLSGHCIKKLIKDNITTIFLLLLYELPYKVELYNGQLQIRYTPETDNTQKKRKSFSIFL